MQRRKNRTQKKRKGTKKKQGKQNNRQRDDSYPQFIFSRQKYKLLNTEMYNKATKTSGFDDHVLKEGNSPQSKVERKKKKENNADILVKRLSRLKVLFL